jgi:hypothetical protein
MPNLITTTAYNCQELEPLSRYKLVSESSQAVIVVTASLKEDERGGQGHTSESLLHQSAT